MKYIIDVPDTQEITYYEESKMVCLKVNEGIVASEIYIDAEPYTEPDREAIEDEVWSFAWKIFNMDMGEYAEIFDDKGCSSDYREAKTKYEKWLKQKDGVHVGDEVENASHKKGIVLGHYISPSNGLKYVRVLYMDDDGNSFIAAWEKNNVCKTGRHFDEVAELLEKMRGEKE